MENKIYDNGMCHTGLLHTQLDKSMNVSVFISPNKESPCNFITWYLFPYKTKKENKEESVLLCSYAISLVSLLTNKGREGSCVKSLHSSWVKKILLGNFFDEHRPYGDGDGDGGHVDGGSGERADDLLKQ